MTPDQFARDLYHYWIAQELERVGITTHIATTDAVVIDGTDVRTAHNAGQLLAPIGYEYESHGTDGMVFRYRKQPHPFAPQGA